MVILIIVTIINNYINYYCNINNLSCNFSTLLKENEMSEMYADCRRYTKIKGLGVGG